MKVKRRQAINVHSLRVPGQLHPPPPFHTFHSVFFFLFRDTLISFTYFPSTARSQESERETISLTFIVGVCPKTILPRLRPTIQKYWQEGIRQLFLFFILLLHLRYLVFSFVLLSFVPFFKVSIKLNGEDDRNVKFSRSPPRLFRRAQNSTNIHRFLFLGDEHLYRNFCYSFTVQNFSRDKKGTFP